MSVIRSLVDTMGAGGPPSQIWNDAIHLLPQLGLSKVVYLDLSVQKKPTILTNACDIWVTEYRETVLAGLDPFPHNCLKTIAPQWTGIGHLESHNHLSQIELDQIAHGSAALDIQTGMSVTIRPDARGDGVGMNLMTNHSVTEFSELFAEYEDTWRAWCQLLYAGLNAQPPVTCEPALTPKERDCLAYVADGLRTVEVAYKMGISEGTVELHMRKARARLGAKTRDQAVAIAVRSRLI